MHLFAYATIFILLGLSLLILSSQVYSVNMAYSFKCSGLEYCEMPIPLIENKVEGPIYLYYELNRFYANHRRFTKSKEPEQLNGKYLDPEELQECDPVARIGDLYPSQRFAVATYSREEEVADPTGNIK